MGGGELGIMQDVATGREMLDQVNQADFRGIGGARKHTLAHKCPTQRYAVKAADERVVVPRIDAMSQSQCMQVAIGFYELLVDPGLLARGAEAHNLLEGCIHMYLIDPL